MNRKQIIQIAVIVAFLGAAGFVLYQGGLFGGGSQAAIPAAQTTAAATQNILPNGDTLDFNSVINPSRFQYNTLQYPQVNAKGDIGVSVENLITPPAAVTK